MKADTGLMLNFITLHNYEHFKVAFHSSHYNGLFFATRVAASASVFK